MNDTQAAPRYLVLSGGIGGAKLALGFAKLVDPDQLTIIANTGDDFRHLGLYISPDVDTLMYTLAGVVNPETGWGLQNETWQCMEALEDFGAETWFRIGDRDLATHLERTRRLAAGESLSEITRALCAKLGVSAAIQPMSDQPSPTRVITAAGPLDFQHYFVRDRAGPVISSIETGSADAAPGAIAALDDESLAAVFVAPSNPWLSIDPILAVRPLRDRLRQLAVPVVAVSPIVGGRAIKGPTAKIMGELGIDVSAAAVARHYQDFLDGFILDETDRTLAAACESAGLHVTSGPTMMNTLNDKIALAEFAIAFAATLNK